MVCVLWSEALKVVDVEGGEAHLGQEVYADGCLVGIVERIIHEACDERRLADCGCQCPLSCCIGVAMHTALLAEEDQPARITLASRSRAPAGWATRGHLLELLQRIRVPRLRHGGNV